MDKGLKYDCELLGKLDTVFVGDDLKLKQVLINILGNSVKFTEPGGSVSLIVREIEKVEESCTLEFVITDTGIGMDQEYIPKLFEAFSQEDASTTNKYGGSGLGMAITKKFIDLMGGTIEVNSQKGVGTTFIVTLKLRYAKDEKHENVNLGLSALLVDDNSETLEFESTVIEQLGIHCTPVSSPNEALNMLKEAHNEGKPFDLLFTNYHNTEMDGLSLVRELRLFDKGKTKTILLHSYSEEIHINETINSLINCIMARPLFKEKLYDRLTMLSKDQSIEGTSTDTSITKSLLKGRKILIAEDVDANAEILGDLLELEEMEFDRADNGQNAVELFSTHEPGYYDAILMDVRMPVMDGLIATKTIRNLGRQDAKSIPIIAMTANVFDEDIESSLSAGMNAHLSKPIEPEILYAKLIDLILNQ